MLGGDPIVTLFSREGVQGVRRVLLDWAESFRMNVDPGVRSWAGDVA